MAAAMRSALIRLGRRACIPAPPMMPPLRPGGVLNVEGLRFYSNESFRMAEKEMLLLTKGNSELFMSTWSKRSIGTLKTVLEADHYLYSVSVFGLTIYSIYVMLKFWRLKIPSGLRTRVPDVKR